jgi:hypothetical protein
MTNHQLTQLLQCFQGHLPVIVKIENITLGKIEGVT